MTKVNPHANSSREEDRIHGPDTVGNSLRSAYPVWESRDDVTRELELLLEQIV